MAGQRQTGRTGEDTRIGRVQCDIQGAAGTRRDARTERTGAAEAVAANGADAAGQHVGQCARCDVSDGQRFAVAVADMDDAEVERGGRLRGRGGVDRAAHAHVDFAEIDRAQPVNVGTVADQVQRHAAVDHAGMAGIHRHAKVRQLAGVDVAGTGRGGNAA